jgi:cyanophycinase
LGLIGGVIIDQHFRERDRVGRLMSAVAMNPAIIGLGLDEDTALEINALGACRVWGSGSLTIVDGEGINYTDIYAVRGYGPVAVFGAKVHILTEGSRFDLRTRRPSPPQ